MKKFMAVLLTALLSLALGQAPASNTFFPPDQSIDSLNTSQICEQDKKKEKSDIPEEKEPECD